MLKIVKLKPLNPVFLFVIFYSVFKTAYVKLEFRLYIFLMCPLYPYHFILGYTLFLWVLWVMTGPCIVNAIKSTPILGHIRLLFNGIHVDKIELIEQETKQYDFYFTGSSPPIKDLMIQELADDGLQHIKVPENVDVIRYDSLHDRQLFNISGRFNVSGHLLGFSKIRFVPVTDDEEDLKQLATIDVEVHRGRKILEIVFISVVILLVTIAYVNMGAALNLNAVRATLRRPIGPAIGLMTQYVIMPLVSFTLGYALFRDTPEMWLGLFLTGCAPGGGGSNLWTYLLKGSLDLSVTMTFASTVAAFFMLPLWVFALGRVIFAGGRFTEFPYGKMVELILGFVVACGIGVLIRHFWPKAADVLKKLLKPIALIFIVVVMTFGVYVNLYIFSFVSWKVIVGGFCLPFFGYLFGGIAAISLKQEWPSVIAISVETGIQNTGLAIGVIKIALQDFSPLDDISMVMPVAVATMTPIPLALIYFYQLLSRKSLISQKNLTVSDVP